MSDPMLISYHTLRKAVGILGMGLFVLLAYGGLFNPSMEPIQRSISFYYWTTSRDILVGVLMMTGALLMTYRGYDLMDRILSRTAGVSALMIALMPCYNGADRAGYFYLTGELNNALHNISAGVFFVTLAAMAFFQFTKGKDKKKNRIYRICAVVIVLCIAALLVIPGISVYWTESIMLLAFGISWLVKGKV
jgi:hypothetical protein